MSKFTLMDRGDGRIEIVCHVHVTGHPSKALSLLFYEQTGRTKWDDGWMGVHGCCGCCLTEHLQKAEQTYLDMIAKAQIA